MSLRGIKSHPPLSFCHCHPSSAAVAGNKMDLWHVLISSVYCIALVFYCNFHSCHIVGWSGCLSITCEDPSAGDLTGQSTSQPQPQGSCFSPGNAVCDMLSSCWWWSATTVTNNNNKSAVWSPAGDNPARSVRLSVCGGIWGDPRWLCCSAGLPAGGTIQASPILHSSILSRAVCLSTSSVSMSHLRGLSVSLSISISSATDRPTIWCGSACRQRGIEEFQGILIFKW